MQEKRTEINSLGEFGLIAFLSKNITTSNPSTIKGIGDDAAVIDHEGYYEVVSTDLLVEDLHFDMAYSPLKHLGYKAVAVNISDICAMNAKPEQITVSLSISNRFSVEAVEELYKGMLLACENYGVDLVGGDTTASLKGLTISITAIGRVAKDKITYRNTAQEGDLICVSGDLGAAYMGLQLLEREKQVWMANPDMKPEFEDKNYIVGRQLKAEARTDVVDALEAVGVVPTSMIDISDGLSSEMLHICRNSNLGCEIMESDIPVDREVVDMAIKFNIDPTTCALNGGEDYELLFTINPEDREKVESTNRVKVIGEMKDALLGSKLKTENGNLHNLTAQGWNHLKKD